MISARRCRVLVFVCALMVCGRLIAADAAPTIQPVKDSQGRVIAIEARPLSAIASSELLDQPDAQKALSQRLSVAVHDDKSNGGAMVGSYTVDNGALRFTPRFAFRAGQAYDVLLFSVGPESLSAEPPRPMRYQFCQQDNEASAPTEVTAIYPAVATVPENLLRFYIQFSAPMSRGSAYEHVQLLDSSNRSVDLPFLELGEELWDPQQQRLTLLIDPGRIKRGVKPRDELGTVLQAGESFTLVVQSNWRDAQNRPLRKEFAKRFCVGPPIEEAIYPAQWHIGVPVESSQESLTIDFPRPLDHALLERTIVVRSISGSPVEGEVFVSREQCRWELRPTKLWSLGKFEIVIDPTLEDLAGNRIGRAFEVDQVGATTDRIETEAVGLAFEIHAR